jgi:hypothetical protein
LPVYGRSIRRRILPGSIQVVDPQYPPDPLAVLEICGAEHTLITSQFPIKAWHAAIGDGILADAICDRLMHGAFKIEPKTPSCREARARAKSPAAKQHS